MRFPEIDLSELKFSHSPLLNKLRKLELRADPKLAEIIDVRTGMDLTLDFVDELEQRTSPEQNFLFNLHGKRGCGKSTLAQGIKGYCDAFHKFRGTINEIVWSRKDYMNCYKGAKPGEVYIIDEDFGFQTQTGSFRLYESMKLAEQTFRIEGVSTIACSVSHSGPHLYDYDLLCFDYDKQHGVSRAIVFYANELRGGMFSRPAGFILFPSKYFIDKKLESEYLKRKKEFTTAVKQGKARTLQQDYDEMAEAVIKKFGWASSQKKPTKDVILIYARRELPHLANTELQDVCVTVKTRLWELRGEESKEKDD